MKGWTNESGWGRGSGDFHRNYILNGGEMPALVFVEVTPSLGFLAASAGEEEF
jgi:hypothetical protein